MVHMMVVLVIVSMVNVVVVVVVEEVVMVVVVQCIILELDNNVSECMSTVLATLHCGPLLLIVSET